MAKNFPNIMQGYGGFRGSTIAGSKGLPSRKPKPNGTDLVMGIRKNMGR